MELLNSSAVYRLNGMYSRHISSKAYKFHCRSLLQAVLENRLPVDMADGVVLLLEFVILSG